ncbi:MAG: helix-turn-helix domain-containing protein [Kiritimatiellaeota bacterium]|nr:helix-turn-helix domain-containing protein [Kiritimatiellota bacterium]
MKPCKLQNPTARKIVSQVWRHLRKNFPNDARILTLIVRGISPFNKREVLLGKTGQWNTLDFGSSNETRAWIASVGSHGRWIGIIKLQDNDQLTIGDVAHEFGYAFTSGEDATRRCAPAIEWADEAAADMHVVRWGLLTCEDIRQRYASDIGNWGASARYCPPPGMECDFYGRHYRLTEGFVFERIETETQHSKEPMNSHAASIAQGLLTPEEAAAKCGIPKTLIMSYARRKKITAYRFGHRTVRFKPSDVDAFMEKMRM